MVTKLLPMHLIPSDVSVLIWMSEPHLKSNWAVGRNMKVSNRHVLVVGGFMVWDLKGKPLGWTFLPEIDTSAIEQT